MLALAQSSTDRRTLRLAVVVAALVLVLLAPAAAQAVTIGPSGFQPVGYTSCANCTVNNNTGPAGTSLSAPFNGVVTRFRTLASGPLALRLMHFAGGTSYSFISTGPTVTGSGGTAVDTFAVRLPLKLGDSLGVDLKGALMYLAGDPSWTRDIWASAPPDDGGSGSTPASGSPSNYFMDYNYDVEPDADGDGFGDESQDRCAGQAGSASGCPPGTVPPEFAQLVQTVSGLAQVGAVSFSKDRKKLRVGVTCPAGRTPSCQGTASAVTADKFKLHAAAAKKVTLKLGSAKFKITGGQSKTVTIKVPSKARKVIKKLKRLRLKLTLAESSTSKKTL